MADSQASFRATRKSFGRTGALVYSRSQLANAKDPSCIKIYDVLFGTAEKLAQQSAVPDVDRDKDWAKRIFEDMLIMDAMQGSAERKHTCPMFFVNFLTQRKTGAEPVTPEEDRRLFGIYDDETILRTDQAVVSEIAIDIKMVGVKHGVSKAKFPRPIELAQTISIKSGDSFLKWKMDDQEFPEDLVNRTWTLSHASAKQQITEANTHIKTNKLIQAKKNGNGVRCLIVLCSTSYESLEKLNRHIDAVHTGDGGISYLPECQSVDGSASSVRAAPPPAAGGSAATACAGQNTNRTPNGISNLLKDKENLTKTVKTDSVPQVSDKLTSVLNKLDTEF